MVLAIHQQNIAEPSHQRISGGLLAIRCLLAVLDQDVVHNQGDFPINRRIGLRIAGEHPKVTVETGILLKILPNMRVIPVHAVIREAQCITVLPARRHRRLADARCPVLPGIHPQPVPMNRGVLIDGVFKLNRDR